MNFNILLDAKGHFVFASKHFENWTGLSFNEFKGRHIKNYIRSAHLRELELFIERCNTEEDSFELHRAVFTAPDGSLKWTDITFTFINGADAQLQLMVSIHVIDERSRAEIDLTLHAHAAFFARHPYGIIHLDRQGRVANVNQQLHTDSGYDLFHLQQVQLLDLVIKKHRFEVLKRFTEATKNAQSSTFDIQVLTARKQPLHINLTIVPVVHKGITLELYLEIKNITQHIALQQDLKKLSLVADKATNGVAVLDRQFKIELINDGFTHMSGYTQADAIGKSLLSLLSMESDDSPEAQQLQQDLCKGTAQEQEIMCYKKDGTIYWNLVKQTPVMNEQGEMEMCITVHTDITEKKKTEMELRLLADDLYRQNKELHQFAYIVSHNLRSPVANIVGLANLLELFKDDADTQNQTLQELTKSVNNLDTVIKDLSYILTVNNASKELLKEPVIIQDLLQQVLVDLQPQILMTDAEITIPSKPLVMRTNRAYIYSIFFNLISNAIKYKSHIKPYIKIDFYMTEAHHVIYVADNGKGIDLEKHSHDLFKPYKRFDFKVEGKGLGLFLVKSHVEALGGSLTVKSELSKGSTFYIKLPFA
ncbi:PAS domain S-box protein [Mucilaginibacter terrae]|uniref:histidine kinase n=1 Tax=Mucilaginibacter terrae TaxID=1955052 RepID=A0ABU3GNQ1_9SPHI|nr:PAS domain S-box protein [Mucilaginibacter terrae]MDT3401417.1 PAS domain S-box-containing protein [Mucilaginibacter terrae]